MRYASEEDADEEEEEEEVVAVDKDDDAAAAVVVVVVVVLLLLDCTVGVETTCLVVAVVHTDEDSPVLSEDDEVGGMVQSTWLW